MTLKTIDPRIKIYILLNLRGRAGMIQMSGRKRSTIDKWRFHMGKDAGAIFTTRRRSLLTISFPLVGVSICHLVRGITHFHRCGG